MSGGVPRSLAAGLALAAFGAIAFSGKAIIVKLAYRCSVPGGCGGGRSGWGGGGGRGGAGQR